MRFGPKPSWICLAGTLRFAPRRPSGGYNARHSLSADIVSLRGEVYSYQTSLGVKAPMVMMTLLEKCTPPSRVTSPAPDDETGGFRHSRVVIKHDMLPYLGCQLSRVCNHGEHCGCSLNDDVWVSSGLDTQKYKS